jgi:nucleoside-diphosphate-sugar epimerase
MTSIDERGPVTGATGYIAGWIIKELLDSGRTVHATVRDPDKRVAVSHLRKLAAGSRGELRLFRADLLEPGSFDAAAAGCELVMHTASPFYYKASRDPERELLKPAVEGTRNVLAAVQRTPAVKRVVLTSSVLAIFGDAVDALQVPNGILNETHWNQSSSLSHQSYAYSKVMAEREAWRLHEAQDRARWDLVVLNPGLVMGPSLTPHTRSGSVSILKQLGSGLARPGVPAITACLVDVRDVARAHVLAGETASASGRYIINGACISLLQLATLLRPHFAAYPLPRRELPKWPLWLVAPLIGLRRAFVSRNAGYPLALDHSRSIQLGVSYRSLEETLVEHFQQLIDDGILPQRGRRRLTPDARSGFQPSSRS